MNIGSRENMEWGHPKRGSNPGFSTWWVFMFGLKTSLMLYVFAMVVVVSRHGLVPQCSTHAPRIEILVSF